MKKDKKITVQEAGRRGGKSTLDRHGVEHFRKIGKKPKKKKEANDG